MESDPRFEAPPAGWKSNSHYRLPQQGAESLLDAGQRVADHIKERMADLSAKEDTLKVFVGHGAAFRHAAHHLGVLAFERLAELSMFHGRPVLLEANTDGSWSHVAGDWKVRQKGADAKD